MIARNRYTKWEPEDEQYLKDNYPLLGAKVCADRLGRTLFSINDRARRLGLYRDITARRNRKAPRANGIDRPIPDARLELITQKVLAYPADTPRIVEVALKMIADTDIGSLDKPLAIYLADYDYAVDVSIRRREKDEDKWE